MASASLHTMSVLGDSPRPIPRQVVEEGTQRTHASSVLQMWRKIEDVHMGSRVEQRIKALRQQSDEFNDDISTQTSETNCSEQRAYLEGFEGNIGCSSLSEGHSEMKAGGHDGPENCAASGEAERETVRQIFRNWTNCGGRGRSSNAPQLIGSSRTQGDNECERVRVVREWVQMTAQERGCYSDKKEGTQIETRIEMFRDGLGFNQNDCRPNGVHRKIRRLRGKQALIDLLVKAEKERQSELQDLTKHLAVSQFPYRNRIQSLLKSRFLRNSNISSEIQKTRSTAAGELRLIRQRQTVSGLREGFLSRTDSSGHSLPDSINDHTQSSSGTNATETKDSKIGAKGEITEANHEQNNLAKEDQNILNLQSVHIVDPEETGHALDGSLTVVNEQALPYNEVNRQQPAGAQLTILIPSTVAEETFQENTSNVRSQHGGHEGEHASQNQEVIDLSRDPSGSVNQGSSFCESSAGVKLVENLNLQNYATEAEPMHPLHSDIEDAQMNRVAYIDWRNTITDDISNNRLVGNVDGQSLDASENDYAESVLTEGNEAWDETESEGFVENWLPRPSRQVSDAFAGSDTLYGSEDNVRTSELNELVGRRRVSNLLESGFRENLNRLLQTYVERQAQTSMGWDLNETISSPVSEVIHQELQTENQNVHSIGASDQVNHSVGPPHTIQEQLWNQVSRMRTGHQPLGFQDWEVISDLRMDITTLQLRMNDMQRMLEACMDMQLELQRSIRQEVSAALNRSVSPEPTDAGPAVDKSKWELVRKGICCVCSHRNIDSLLYRCGHMCACTKCATQLFEERSKCPMCRSPIVEVIRAYSIQQ